MTIREQAEILRDLYAPGAVLEPFFHVITIGGRNESVHKIEPKTPTLFVVHAQLGCGASSGSGYQPTQMQLNSDPFYWPSDRPIPGPGTTADGGIYVNLTFTPGHKTSGTLVGHNITAMFNTGAPGAGNYAQATLIGYKILLT
jgi:hypothetical protein